MDEYFGSFLGARRKKLGLTAEEIYHATGISPVHLEYIESGNPFPFGAIYRLKTILRFNAVALLRRWERREPGERRRLAKLGWVEKPLRGLEGTLPWDWYEHDPRKKRKSSAPPPPPPFCPYGLVTRNGSPKSAKTRHQRRLDLPQ